MELEQNLRWLIHILPETLLEVVKSILNKTVTLCAITLSSYFLESKSNMSIIEMKSYSSFSSSLYLLHCICCHAFLGMRLFEIKCEGVSSGGEIKQASTSVITVVSSSMSSSSKKHYPRFS